jgi:hypothetical protein
MDLEFAAIPLFFSAGQKDQRDPFEERNPSHHEKRHILLIQSRIMSRRRGLLFRNARFDRPGFSCRTHES